jgi:hypothetical protein
MPTSSHFSRTVSAILPSPKTTLLKLEEKFEEVGHLRPEENCNSRPNTAI